MIELTNTKKKPGRKQTKTNNPKVLGAIEKYLDTNGYYRASIPLIQNYLSKVLSPSDLPCKSTISSIMRKSFHLKYASLHKANLKYRDPTYDEKRLWVSRLLA